MGWEGGGEMVGIAWMHPIFTLLNTGESAVYTRKPIFHIAILPSKHTFYAAPMAMRLWANFVIP
jgi:hypothetical protein